MNDARRHPARCARRGAFTLVEMLVVISIIVLLVAVTLPSFSTIIASSNYTAAISQTTASLGSARSIAMSRGVRTAVAFLFDVRTERYTLVILEQYESASLLSDLPTAPPEHAYAVGFRPAQNTTPIELPRGTAVFGLSFAHIPDPANNMIDQFTQHWYAGETLGPDGTEYTDDDENYWLFPRNDPYLFWEPGSFPAGMDDPWSQLIENGITDEVRDALRHANSFCVQFNPDGSTVTSSARGSYAQPANAYIELPLDPVDRNPADPIANPDSTLPYDEPNIFDPENDGTAFELRLGVTIGERSRNPEVILRTVSQLAVVDLAELQKGTGQQRVWTLHPHTSLAPWPMYDPDGRPGNGDEIAPGDLSLDPLCHEVSRWIDRNAEIMGFDRYTGTAIRSTSQ
ncbi:MAG: prepilin-type N-terminal cleavage/methylation domain-containing protein [Phycisphaeraceae bacterium]|nr:prepilin-type N-terminal cleavage/methylation domain-containing protein [Phycisphaeraceae bacterium]